MSKPNVELQLVRVIFEGEGKVNLALAFATFEGEYYAINIEDKDYNTLVKYLPDYLTDRLALLKLSKKDTHIEGVGYRQEYEFGHVRPKLDGEAYEFMFPDEVFYVDIDKEGFRQVVKDCKVRRSNLEKSK